MAIENLLDKVSEYNHFPFVENKSTHGLSSCISHIWRPKNLLLCRYQLWYQVVSPIEHFEQNSQSLAFSQGNELRISSLEYSKHLV